MRAGWILYLTDTKSSPQPLSPAMWRHVLGVGALAAPPKPNSRSAKNKTSVSDLFQKLLRYEGVGLSSMVVPLSVVPTALPAPSFDTAMGIIWELCEFNFRFELMFLDSKACPPPPFTEHDTQTDRQRRLAEHNEERQLLIMLCFYGRPCASILTVNRKWAKCGLAGVTLQDRLPYLQRFRRVMDRWPGVKPPTWYAAGSTWVGPSVMETFERDLIRFYVQTFFDYCGRAPILPRTMTWHM